MAEKKELTHEQKMIVRAQESAKRLKNNDDFLNVMQLLVHVSAYHTVISENADINNLAKHNGKRETWVQLRTALGLDNDTLASIEYGIK